VRVEPTNAALVGTRAARNGTRDRGAKEAAVAASERLLTAKRVREEKALAVANAAARISAPAWVLKRGRFHPRFIALTGDDAAVKKACRAYRVYFTKPTPEEIKRGDYLLDHSIISYLVDPEGEFADYYGKSLTEDEMFTRVGKLMGDWERQKWWDSVLPAFMATPQMTEGQKRAAEAAKPGNRSAA